jgi:hypothetical protein
MEEEPMQGERDGKCYWGSEKCSYGIREIISSVVPRNVYTASK